MSSKQIRKCIGLNLCDPKSKPKSGKLISIINVLYKRAVQKKKKNNELQGERKYSTLMDGFINEAPF